eukprot:810018-Amorphochlora_amoeboformis.AAC.1
MHVGPKLFRSSGRTGDWRSHTLGVSGQIVGRVLSSMLRKLAILFIGQAIFAFGSVVNVGGLFDGSIVDMAAGEEGLRINQSLNMPPNNVKVTSITSVSMGDFAASPGVLGGLDALVIPFQQISSLILKMSTADQAALADWVRAGKL